MEASQQHHGWSTPAHGACFPRQREKHPKNHVPQIPHGCTPTPPSLLEKPQTLASGKARQEPSARSGQQHAWGQLTFVWLGSPGLLPSDGLAALLSTRGLTTWRKGLLRGKPLTLIPSERGGQREVSGQLAGGGSARSEMNSKRESHLCQPSPGSLRSGDAPG